MKIRLAPWVLAFGGMVCPLIPAAAQPAAFTEVDGWQAAPVRSESMAPTLRPGDILLFNTRYFSDAPPRHGEVIVFNVRLKSSTRDTYPKEEWRTVPFAMRIAGLAGDKVATSKGHLWRNGTAVDEPYADFSFQSSVLQSDTPQVLVPAGHVYVLGDNRGNANDSRFIGTIPVNDIVGKAMFITTLSDAKPREIK